MRFNEDKYVYAASLKRDFFSDLRDQVFTDAGVTQAQRDAAQPYVSKIPSLLPSGGNIPSVPQNTYSAQQPTGFMYKGDTSPILYAAAAVVLVLIIMKVRK